MGKGCACVVMDNKLHITFQTAVPNQVKHIFDYWVHTHRKSRVTKLTSDRRSKIQARLNERYTVRDIKLAIDGILCSSFHVDGGYTDIINVCGTGAKLERCMELGRHTKIVRRQGILGHMSKVSS